MRPTEASFFSFRAFSAWEPERRHPALPQAVTFRAPRRLGYRLSDSNSPLISLFRANARYRIHVKPLTLDTRGGFG